jgi:hypothetical protein
VALAGASKSTMQATAMSEAGQTRKCLRWRGMSVLPPRADAARPFAAVHFVPLQASRKRKALAGPRRHRGKHGMISGACAASPSRQMLITPMIWSKRLVLSRGFPIVRM